MRTRTWRRTAVLIALAVGLGVLTRCAPWRFDQRSGVLPPADAVAWVWTGALQPTSIRVVARLTRPSERVRLLFGHDEGLDDAVASPFHTADAASRLAVAIELGGLEPGTRYHYALEVDGEADGARRGSFRTPEAGPQSFTFAFGSCARTGSSHPVFDTIRAHDPLFLLHLGDLHYANIRQNEEKLYHRAIDRVMRSAGQSRLFRAVPVAYVWDDHDYGGNNSDRTAAGRDAASRAYRQLVPHYLLPAGSGAIYQAFTVGRVRFLVTDSRSEKAPRTLDDGPGKTVLGAEQKAWLKRQLLAAKDRYPLIVWASTFPWIAEPERGADHWGGYQAERLELARFIEANGIDRLVMLSGDAHMLAIDDGRHNRLTAGGGPGFPVMHAAAFDQLGSRKGGPYSSRVVPGPGHFGLMTVEDAGGDTVSVTWSGRDHSDRELVAHRFVVGEGFSR